MSVVVDIDELLKKYKCEFWLLQKYHNVLGTFVYLFNKGQIKRLSLDGNEFYAQGEFNSQTWDTVGCTFKPSSSYGNIIDASSMNNDAFTNHPTLLQILNNRYPRRKHGSDFIEGLKYFTDNTCDIVKPIPPSGGGAESGQTENSSCSDTGQFGGGGTPLKDIKLFLYANNVTKGTIKLSKSQVEVGTFATDWRPNPSDYVERHSPAYKEVKGLAIQHNQSQNKKYLEIETADGYAYGVDLWGGDTKKLLEQQQAEIEELKKLVKTLELRINV